jgi:hypothetical protein
MVCTSQAYPSATTFFASLLLAGGAAGAAVRNFTLSRCAAEV